MKITVKKGLKDLDNYIGIPIILKYILNEFIEIEVKFPVNWKITELKDILSKTFIEEPDRVHVISIEPDKTILN